MTQIINRSSLGFNSSRSVVVGLRACNPTALLAAASVLCTWGLHVAGFLVRRYVRSRHAVLEIRHLPITRGVVVEKEENEEKREIECSRGRVEGGGRETYGAQPGESAGKGERGARAGPMG